MRAEKNSEIITARPDFFTRAALFILVSGVLLRIFAVIHSGPAPHFKHPAGMDEAHYLEISENIRSHRVFGAWTGGFFTRSTRSPGYPSLLAGIEVITGRHPMIPGMLNIVLDSGSMLLIMLLGLKLYGRKASLAATAAYAFFAPAFIYMPLATPDIMSVFLLLAAVAAFLKIGDRDRYAIPAFALIFAMLLHTRPVFLLLAPLPAAGIYLAFRADRLKSLFNSGLYILLVIAFCIPWGVRNYRLHKALVPVSTVSGWHLIASAVGAEELSVKYLTDYIYAPENRNFSEGDYYRDSQRKFWRIFFKKPFRILGTGIARVALFWFPWKSPERIFLPWAYVAPVHISKSVILPLPDLEGWFYAGLVFFLISIRVFRKRMKNALAEWARKSAPILLMSGFYLLAHSMAYPLHQYRFTIEPLFLTLGIGFAAMLISRETEGALTGKLKNFLGILPHCICLLMLIFLAAAYSGSKAPPAVNYEVSAPPGFMSYRELRNSQWRNRGNLPKNARAALCGVFKYPCPNQKFSENSASSSFADNTSCGKIYVKQMHSTSPMGTGDVKINFRAEKKPPPEEIVRVYGNALNGLYKDIIIEVERWEQLYP